MQIKDEFDLSDDFNFEKSDKDLYNFNREWILFLIDKYNFDKSYKEYKNTGKASFDFLGEFDF